VQFTIVDSSDIFVEVDEVTILVDTSVFVSLEVVNSFFSNFFEKELEVEEPLFME